MSAREDEALWQVLRCRELPQSWDLGKVLRTVCHLSLDFKDQYPIPQMADERTRRAKAGRHERCLGTQNLWNLKTQESSCQTATGMTAKAPET